MQDELMHDLIVRSLTEQLSVEDQRVLSDWRLKSPDNERYYQDLVGVWELASKNSSNYIPDTDKHWNDLLLKIESEPGTGRSLFLFRGSSFYKIAAAILLVIGLGYIMVQLSAGLLNETIVKQTATDINVFYLPDSSVVWLNKNSKLTYPAVFEKDQRVVYLEGEAFFDVKRNPAQPFIIHAGGTSTKVLGTSFDLKAYAQDQEVSLTVVTGKVAFSSDHKTVLLLPQETGVYSKSKKEIALQKKVSREKALVWIKNEEAFKNNDVYAMEKKHPELYLHNAYGSRTNWINQTVVEGQIENLAKVCSYENLYMKVIYISKKNKVYEYRFHIQNKLNPGEKVDYKQKLPDWFVDTEEVRVTIEGVEGLNFK